MNFVNFALIALSSIVGHDVSNNNKIDLNEANIALVNEISESYHSSQIIESSDVYNMHGVNSFSLFKFDNDNYVLIDKITNAVVESGVTSQSCYKDSFNSFIVRTESDHFYFDLFSNNFISFTTNKTLNKKNLRSDWDTNLNFCVSSDYPNAHFVSNAKYFDNLNSRFSENNDNICGIIATEILLGYYDTFVNDCIVPEDIDIKGDYLSMFTNNGNSPGTDIEGEHSNNKFSDLLVTKSIACNNENPHLFGMDNYQVSNLVQYYLNNRNIPYNITTYPFSFNYSLIAEAAIESNHPFIGALEDHFVVVYGYDDNYYYVSVGWTDANGNDTCRIPKQYFTNFSSPYFLSIDIGQHVHSNNYYNSADYGLYCGCGHHHSNRLVMHPSDWGFEEQYFFNYTHKTHTKDNITFTSDRLRTGFIQSSVINLSPRRQNSGHAEFLINLPKYIYEFNLELAWWSPVELQDDGYADLNYHYSNGDFNAWVTDYQSIHDLDLEEDYENLKNYQFLIDDYCNGIGFDLTNLAVGNRNKGRLSIGTIIIDYYL